MILRPAREQPPHERCTVGDGIYVARWHGEWFRLWRRLVTEDGYTPADSMGGHVLVCDDCGAGYITLGYCAVRGHTSASVARRETRRERRRREANPELYEQLDEQSATRWVVKR